MKEVQTMRNLQFVFAACIGTSIIGSKLKLNVLHTIITVFSLWTPSKDNRDCLGIC